MASQLVSKQRQEKRDKIVSKKRQAEVPQKRDKLLSKKEKS